MKETFPVSYIFLTEDKPTNVQNVMIVSSNQPYEFDRLTLLEMAKNSPADYLVDELSKPELFYQGIVDTSDVPFLTDQYNPSEVLINPLTSKPYEQEFQNEQMEKREHRDDLINLGLGIVISVIAAIWLVYFRKNVWTAESLSSST